MVFRLWILLNSVGLVLGQGSTDRYDILRGTRGEPACTLQSKVAKCALSDPSSILARDDTTSPVPSTCTCNTIFFNIWSACCYSTGNNTLPNLKDWEQECTNSGKQIDSSPDLRRSLGVDIPSWATLSVPSGNATFDLQRAVVLSIPIRWTTLQRMLPVAAAVMTLFICGTVLLICGRGGSRPLRLTESMKRLRSHGARKVNINFNKGDNWKIDPEDDPRTKEQLFVNFAPSIEEATPHGQSARVPDPEQTDVHGSDKKPKTILNSTSEKLLMGANSFKVPTPPSVLIPWKRKPPTIKLVPATSRFRVDSDADKSICSGESDKMKGRNGTVRVDEEQLDDQYISPEDEEATNLITPTENEERISQEVLLISKDGRQFTIESRSTNTVSVNSHIKIISPSVSSASRCSAVNAPTPTKPATFRIPTISPPPNHPAPAPPIIPRRAERPDGSGPSLQHFLPPPFLPPIREASPSHSYSSSSLRRSHAISRLSSSNSGSSCSIRTSPAARSSPNLTTTSNIRLPPHYSDLHRTGSQRSEYSMVTAENEEILYDPYLDSTANRYGNMHSVRDGSDESFYCTSPEPLRMQSVGFASPSTTTDPAAFFPGPVRAAGYPIMTSYT